jgi:hypothetical protein
VAIAGRLSEDNTRTTLRNWSIVPVTPSPSGPSVTEISLDRTTVTAIAAAWKPPMRTSVLSNYPLETRLTV